jgi:hypothetical protein
MLKSEKIVIIPTGSTRKRELIRVFLEIANGGELKEGLSGLPPLAMIKWLKEAIPNNGNGANQKEEYLGTWQGVDFYAVANGGETNESGLTPFAESLNKARHALMGLKENISSELLAKVEWVVGLDGEDQLGDGENSHSQRKTST